MSEVVLFWPFYVFACSGLLSCQVGLHLVVSAWLLIIRATIVVRLSNTVQSFLFFVYLYDLVLRLTYHSFM